MDKLKRLKRIIAIVLAVVLLAEHIPVAAYVGENKNSVHGLSKDSGYTVEKVLLSDGANDTNDDGKAFYNQILDKNLTVKSIQDKGGHYAKCKPEEAVKGDIDKEYYYKLAFENKIGGDTKGGAFVTTGFYDNKEQHHGSSHFVRKYYRKYQEYSQVYSYVKTNEEKKTKTYYYFIHVWRELVDDKYHETSSNDIMTYCLEYGAPLSNDDAVYTKQKKSYDALSDAQKKKVALAIFYGPHRDADGVYYSTKNKKLTSCDGYNPATWNITMWKRYIATQLYIWSVQTPDTFSLSDAKKTAKSIDKKYITNDATYCYDVVCGIENYVEEAMALPSFCTRKSSGGKLRYMTKKADGSYEIVLQDKKKLLQDGLIISDSNAVQSSVNQDGSALTLTAKEPIDEAVLTYVSEEMIPVTEGGLLYYASDSAQNMVRAEVTFSENIGYFKVATRDVGVGEGTIKIRKRAADTNEFISGVKFAVFTTSANAAIYDPETNAPMQNENGELYNANDYIAGMLVENDQVIAYSTAEYQSRIASGERCELLYHVAYYAENGHAVSPLNRAYTLETNNSNIVQSGELLCYEESGAGTEVSRTYCAYYLVEWETPAEYSLPYPVSIMNGDIQSGTICAVVEASSQAWNSDHCVFVDLLNEPKKGELMIVKKDELDERPLSGVIFDIYSDKACTNLYASITTDADGKAVLTDVPRGMYYAVERTGQAGYVKCTEVLYLVVQPNQVTEQIVYNRPWTVRITIKKQVDKTGWEKWKYTPSISLKGAKFGLYAGEDVLGANGTVLIPKDTLIAELITDEDGCASYTSDNLRLGKYYVKELSAPKGYHLNKETFYIDATDASNVETLHETTVLEKEVVVKETMQGIPLSVYKEMKVMETGKTTIQKMQGAVFSVYHLDAMRMDGIQIEAVENFSFLKEEYDQYRVPINSQSENPYQIVTDSEGKAITLPLLYGEYAVVEVQAPYGYGLAVPKKIVLPADTDEPKVAFVDEPLLGSISVKKVGKVPVAVEEYQTEYGLKCNRLVFEEKGLADVEFAILDTKGQVVDTLVTNEQGEATSIPLPIGLYRVCEKNAPDGYYREKHEYKVELKANEAKMISVNLDVKNDFVSTSLLLEKAGEIVSDITPKGVKYDVLPLEGAVFGIYTENPIANCAGDVILEENMLVGIGKTDANGKWIVEGDYLPGNYYAKEISAPLGYVLSNELYPFTIKPSGDKESEVVHITNQSIIKNDMLKADVQLLKVDASGHGEKLQGAIFGLYDANTDALVMQCATDAQGVIFIADMPYGKWYFQELRAPKGFQLSSEKYEFEIVDNTTKCIELIAENEEEPQLGFDDDMQFMVIVCGIIALGLSGTMLLFARKRKYAKKDNLHQ